MNTVVLFLDTRGMGGIETHVYQLAKQLHRRDIPVKVIFWQEYSLSQLQQSQTLTDHPLWYSLRREGIPLGCARGRLGRLIQLIPKGALVHSHGYKANLINKGLSLLGRWSALPTHHNGDAGTGRVRWYVQGDELTSLLFEPIAVSDEIHQRLRKKGRLVSNFVAMDDAPPVALLQGSFLNLPWQKTPATLSGERDSKQARRQPNEQDSAAYRDLRDNLASHSHAADSLTLDSLSSDSRVSDNSLSESHLSNSKDSDIDDDCSQIAFVGRMSPEKNPAGFCRMAATFLNAASGPQARHSGFHLYGDGPLLASLKPDYPELVFHGQQTMTEHWHRIQLLCITSSNEGLPLAALEAMVRGIPVCAFEVGDLPKLIDHGQNGCLVPAGDQDAMQACLEHWFQMTELQRQQMRMAAYHKILHQFSDRAVIPHILEHYLTVAA